MPLEYKFMGEKILVLDSDRNRHKMAESLLDEAGYEAVAVEDEVSLLQALKEEGGFAAVLVRESAYGGLRGMDVLQDIKTIFPEMPVVISARSLTPQAIQHFTGIGAFFCMEKEAEGDLLVKVLSKAINENKSSSEKKSA
ncbi:MAG TPA: response regulator [Candidatus Hypogeohydataceae bacterium YC41]